jgi:hypothetical protein
LFVEQLVALRAERGDTLEIPPTLHALLAARIDSLTAPERSVVERASVEGRFFHRGSVVELAPEAVRPDVSAHLLALVRKEFVRPDRAQLPGDDGYRFAHVLVRDAAYEAMAKELRADLHERFAWWLERVAADRLGELEEILGYHFERAALYRRELELPDEHDAARRGAVLLARSGMRAHDRGDATAAENLLGRAVSLLPTADPLRAECLPLLASAIFSSGELERALGVLAQARTEIRAGDPTAEASLWALETFVRLHSVPELDVADIEREVQLRRPAIDALGGDARAFVWLRRLELMIALAYRRPGRRRRAAARRGPSCRRSLERAGSAVHAERRRCARTDSRRGRPRGHARAVAGTGGRAVRRDGGRAHRGTPTRYEG